MCCCRFGVGSGRWFSWAIELLSIEVDTRGVDFGVDFSFGIVIVSVEAIVVRCRVRFRVHALYRFCSWLASGNMRILEVIILNLILVLVQHWF